MHFTSFDPPIPALQIGAFVLVVALLAIGLYWRGERKGSGRVRAVLAVLRTAGLLLLGFLLLNPVVIESAESDKGKPPLYLLIDASRSMKVRDVKGQARFDAAKQEVLANDRLLSALGAACDVRPFIFEERAKRAPLEEARAITKPTGSATEMGRALASVTSDAAQSSGRSAGVLLVSDGRDNGGVSPLSAARDARTAGLPVWTLCLGTQTGAKDIGVLTYASESFAFARQRTTVGADIDQKGYGATTLTATLSRNGKPVTQQAVTFAGDGRQTVRFPVTEESPGLYRYTISVSPRSDEANPRNNTRSLFLRVGNDRIKVLLIDARPSWDTKFLGQSLRQDPVVDLTAIYRLSPDRDFSVTSDEGKPRAKAAGAPRVRLPKTAEELFPYDVVVIGKGFEDLLTDAGAAMLKRYVSERGGSLVFFRGKAEAGSEKLRDLEPLVWDNGEVRNLQMQLTAEGRANPAFTFPAPEEPETIIHKLPDLISATRVRGEHSLAVVLARGVGDAEKEPMATVAYQRYGSGRIMALAGQGLWQWAFLPDDMQRYDAVYRSFWTQMLGWLVRGSDFLPGQDFSLKTDRLSAVPGQRVNLLVLSKHGPSVEAVPTLEVIDPEGKRTTVTPARSQAFGATFVGTYTPTKVGDYTVVMRTGPGEGHQLEAAFTVGENRQEDANTEADPELMREIAEASGGAVATLETLAQLPEWVKQAQQRRLTTEQQEPAWDRPGLFLLLCAVFGTEWYLRRRQGMC